MQHEPPSSSSFGTRSARRGRSSSLSADYRRISKTNILLPPLVNPPPQYVAHAAARQLIAADQHVSSGDGTPLTGSADITDGALDLLNGFLDNILFSILLTAKSTKLLAIRPAVSEVLKPRLAREVVAAADDELAEYLSGGEDEELSDFHGGLEPTGHFESERSWKLIRLKCMVYSRLGDMEEEDEEDYLRREGLDDSGSRPGRFSSHVGHITPAATIFLTSILEYISENCLIIVADNARVRLGLEAARADIDQPDHSLREHPLIVTDFDVEKIALNPTLGRLWRTWRKHSRLPGLTRTLSRESLIRYSRKSSSRQSSIGTVETLDEPSAHLFASQPPVSEGAESLDIEPAELPLPLSDNDIDEIEVPGFVAQVGVAIHARSFRPRSLFITNTELTAPTSPNNAVPRSVTLDNRAHSRSFSLPSTPSAKGASFSSRLPEIITTTPGSVREHLEPMGEDVDELRPSAESHNSPDDQNSHTLLNTRPYHDDHDCESPVSSLHSDAIGLAITHSPLSEVPSPISRPESRASSERSIYEDCEPRAVETTPSVAPQIFQRRHEDRTFPHPIQRPANDYHGVSSPIPERSPLRGFSKELHPRDEEGDRIVETSFVSSPITAVSSPPRLSPLQELVSSAPSTPEQSPVTDPRLPGESSYMTSQHRQSDRSITSQNKPVYSRSPVSNIPTITGSPRSTNSGHERAGVQRVSPTPNRSPTELNSSGFKPRLSESGSASGGSIPERRPIASSGSGTSQVSSKLKGLVTRQAAIPPPRPVGDANGDGTSDLDQLIESDETIRYTLTPRNMREIEDPGSPRWASVRTETNPEPGVLGEGYSKEANGEPSKNAGLNGLRIVTSTDDQIKRPSQQARDARPENKSVREFADFIKYTGPDSNTPKLYTPIVIPSSEQLDKLRVPEAGSPSSSNPASPRGHTMSAFVKKSNRPRLEARPAATPKDNQTSDLIDFIREGPPRDGAHRIPRTVAPFRTTMDSDEFQSLSPIRMGVDPFNQGSTVSTQDSSTTVAKSVNSSFNSHTGLLESTNTPSSIRAVKAPPQLRSVLDSPVFEDHQPVRTRRRPRDPYAIDSDSDDDLFEQPKRAQPVEESLADFLRSVPSPPENSDPPQLFSVNERAANAAINAPNTKRPSSMKSRLIRASSTERSLESRTSKPLRPQKSFGAHVPAVPPLPPFISSPTSVNSSNSFRRESVVPAFPGQAERLRSNYGGGSRAGDEARRPYRPDETGTAALADFFRNTGPPTAPKRVPSTRSTKENTSRGRFSRVFLRKKKQHA